MGTNKIILGCQWGDEGKGKIVDLLAADSDVTARFQGGANAGHTIVVNGKQYILHLIPSGIIHPGKQCFIGNGVVLDPFAFKEELEFLVEHGIDYSGRLWISPATNLVLPYHKLIEDVEENRRGTKNLGTTKRGIGPAYVDKVARHGIRVIDLFAPERLRKRLEFQKTIKSQYLTGSDDERADLNGIYDSLMSLVELFQPLVKDISLALYEAYNEGKSILFEGAQGTMLDVDLGTYPYTTSSNTTIGGALTGLGISPKMIDSVIGVVKAYTTRVGAGPFPTELIDETGEKLQQAGNEFGASTGRPRRCGWLDLVILKHTTRINGVNAIALTKLDVLDEFEEIHVCTRYEHEGNTLENLPLDLAELNYVKPIYETLKGWNTSIRGITNYDDLPEETKAYIAYVADFLKVDIALISTGPGREETIIL